ncbi:MAG: hypothetical protein HY428_03220 [Candidatus Levybacteria bacterium]|nr:hypothetical protein [Candidatus Levybacteria bacterium]
MIDLDQNIRKVLIAVITLGIFLLLIVSLPFSLGLVILGVIAYFLWKRFAA